MTQNLPAHLQGFQTRDIGSTALANLGSSMPPHVSIGNNRFTLIDAANNEIPVPTFDPKLGPYLDACIIDVADVMSRIYFSGTYDAGADGVRPDCFSDNGVGPSISASSPQAPTCAACPRSEWTKINANGKKVPWCTQKYKVALLIPGFDTVFLLAIPPNSHGPLREYLATCKGNGAMMENLVTRISFISQGTLQFHPQNWIDAAVAELRERAYAEKKTDLLVGRNDMARPATAIAPPVQQAVQFAPQGQPQGYGQGYAAPGPTAAQLAQPQGTAQWPPGQQHPVGQGFAAAATGQAANAGQTVAQQLSTQWPQQGQSQPGNQWPQQGAPAQQVQQPGPFGGTGATPVQNAPAPGPSMQNAAPFAATTSPSDPAPARRKRRTQAEIAAANAGQQPAGAQQAPFPHPGQQTVPFAQTATAGAPTGTGAAFATQPATSAANPVQLEFGIGQGQPASASPDVQSALDDFFMGQT